MEKKKKRKKKIKKKRVIVNVREANLRTVVNQDHGQSQKSVHDQDQSRESGHDRVQSRESVHVRAVRGHVRDDDRARSRAVVAPR